ncbi:hypothetical protein C8R44DRAFT_730351 [Mycena epipterygia]|nr:hypothetical protein C8R44DRAFT_730351 [Mycena epipterygia]
MSLGHVVPLPVDLPPVTPLNVPRRRTLCTDKVLPSPADNAAAPGLSRFASHSQPTRRNDVGSGAPTKLRPLPRIPTHHASNSASPTPRRQTSRMSLRPLPCIPEPVVPVSATPPNLLPLSPPVAQSDTRLPPPFTLPPPYQFAPVLQTPRDALERPAFPGPPTHVVWEAPCSENTARQMRRSKLSRHLDFSVQLGLSLDRRDKGDSPDDILESDLPSQTLVAGGKLSELNDDDFDASTADDDGDGYSVVLRQGQTVGTIQMNRYSRKWIREKGGERWVEDNRADILRRLREL